MSVKAFSDYWSKGSNQFDFLTTWLLAGTTAFSSDLSHYANLLRLLRLVRVVKKLKQYPSVQFMVSTVVRLVEAAGDILSLLGVLLYLFMTFSVNLFGGVLYEGHEKLEGTAYAHKHWYVFNFNDCIMAFMTWFTHLLGEYEPEWADALYNTSAWGELAWYVFPIYYLLGVAILWEIFTAFTIETFLALKEEAEDLRKREAGEEESDSDPDDEELGIEAEKNQETIIDAVFWKLNEDCESLHVSVKRSKTDFWKALKVAYRDLVSDKGSGKGSDKGSGKCEK